MKDAPDREDLLKKLERANEVNIAVIGRKSKRKVSAPVWFVVDGARVTLVPMKGTDSPWFRNLVKDPRIELSVGGTAASSKAAIVRDPERVEGVLDRFRAKYKSMWSESYYTNRDVYVEVPL